MSLLYFYLLISEYVFWIYISGVIFMALLAYRIIRDEIKETGKVSRFTLVFNLIFVTTSWLGYLASILMFGYIIKKLEEERRKQNKK